MQKPVVGSTEAPGTHVTQLEGKLDPILHVKHDGWHTDAWPFARRTKGVPILQ